MLLRVSGAAEFVIDLWKIGNCIAFGVRTLPARLAFVDLLTGLSRLITIVTGRCVLNFAEQMLCYYFC